MRDFYDVYEVMKMYSEEVDKDILLKAFSATCKKRETVFNRDEITEILSQIEENVEMAKMWEQFRKKNYFVGNLKWDDVLSDVVQIIHTYIINVHN